MRRQIPLVAIVAIALGAVLGGCATAGPGTGAGTQTADPAPTAACPMQPGVELPPGCAPYDPDAAMAQNDRYRERMEMDAASLADNAALLERATTALQTLQAGGPVSADSVRAALEEAGAVDVQLREGAGDVLFGAAVPGGCVYGDIDGPTGELTIDLGGVILDGGCLPAQ